MSKRESSTRFNDLYPSAGTPEYDALSERMEAQLIRERDSLKPCPFCGEKPGAYIAADLFFFVHCSADECGLPSIQHKHWHYIRNRWNRRADG